MRRPAFLLLFIAVISALMRVCLFPGTNTLLQSFEGSAARFEGVVTDVNVKESYTAFTVKCRGEKALVRVSLDPSSDRSAAYSLAGRKVEVTGKISLPDGRRNPGCFDYRTYLKSKGIYTVCDTNRYKIKASEIKRPLLNLSSRLKAGFYEAMEKYMDEKSLAVTAGILFGETGYMDDDWYQSFRQNGIAHILAVSGLHVNMVYDICSKLLRKRRSLAADLCAASLICSYALLSNFSVSVLRASAMILLKLAAFHTDRRYDSCSAISVAGSAMLFARPALLFTSGFQLSFAAAYSMALVYPWISAKTAALADRYGSDLVFKAGKALAPGLAAWAGTAPLCAFHFNSFSFVSLLLNPLAITLAGIIVPAGILGFVSVSLLPKSLSDLAAYIFASFLRIFYRLLEAGNTAATFLSGDNSVCSPPAGAVILYYVLFFFLCSETRYSLFRKKSFRELALIEAGLILAAVILPYSFKITGSVFPWEYGAAKVTFLDVGQGDCIHLHYGGKDVLIDGGGSYYTNTAEKTLRPYLLKNGIRDIDLAVVTHEDSDHCKGIYELEEIFTVKKTVTNRDVYGDAVTDENGCCIVASAVIDGRTFLFMSDADTAREAYLMKAYPSLSCDVLKVAHHGSAGSTSAAFLKRISPSFAVISVGKNNSYGHPSERVIELLSDSDIIYARTDECGAICLKRANGREMVFVNAAKDRVWHIRKTPPRSTLQEP